MIFLKLGGSLITDKTGVEQLLPDVLARLAGEIGQVWTGNPDLRLLVGHGAGSFGHVAAAKYDTRHGVQTAVQWHGFAEVHASMARLNRLVVEALLAAGVSALSLQPSALARCENGRITTIDAAPVLAALDSGLVPVVYGDVAFDGGWGGTIISTEEIMAALAGAVRPSWLLLAGVTEGVLDQSGQLIPTITPANLPQIEAALGGSHGTDVTGGMASKVRGMLALAEQHHGLQVLIFSGLTAGMVKRALVEPETAVGTRIAQA
ncbi:MAG: isopentenyl phosphate kinase family protein [Ardenticatenaceae bacterium]|nr:isopentenyl phosphate kinase family protein [Ardenticatenaceae bacterium]